MAEQTTNNAPSFAGTVVVGSQGRDLLDLALLLARSWKWLIFGPIVAGGLALGYGFLQPNVYTATAVLLPPQQQQSVAASALQSLGVLAGAVGGGSLKTPADEYVALLQSATLADRLVDRFKLMSVFEVVYRVDARKALAANTAITLGKKDGLISIAFTDRDPKRAADIANGYVDELRRLSNDLALTEAQTRRAFFEKQLQQVKAKLTEAQKLLQSSGISEGTLKAEPRSAAENFAKLQAQATAAEVRLQTLRGYMTEQAPEFRQAETNLMAIRAQLSHAQKGLDQAGDQYIDRYREYKYFEALFELFSRQYELAKVDESREGPLLQVLDTALPPEKKSGPKRTVNTIITAVLAEMALFIFVLLRNWYESKKSDPYNQQRLAELRRVLSSRAA